MCQRPPDPKRRASLLSRVVLRLLPLLDRAALRWSRGRRVDGLLILAFMDRETGPILARVEQALALIARYNSLRYRHLLRDLDRILVTLLPAAVGDYTGAIRTCRLDKRFVLADAVDPELIAAVIVHEATHARLDRLGVAYAEQQRPRIEAICVRREIAFANKLPRGKAVRALAEQRLATYGNLNLWTDADIRARHLDGGCGIPALCRLSRMADTSDTRGPDRNIHAATDVFAQGRPARISNVYCPVGRCGVILTVSAAGFPTQTSRFLYQRRSLYSCASSR